VALAVAAALFSGIAVVGLPSSAMAADFDPALGGSSSAAREWKINILGRVLGKAAPTAWQREQLANQNRYNQGWETLEAMYGSSAGKPYSGPPDSYEDYVIRKKELETTGKLTVTGPTGQPTTTGSGTTFKAPATKTSKFVNGAAGAATAVSGASLGVMVGNAGADLGLSFFGMTTEGLVCGQSNAAVKTYASLINGVDCNLLNFDESYVPNQDSDGNGVTLSACSPQTGVCYNFQGVNPIRSDATAYCGQLGSFKPGDGNQQFMEWWFVDESGQKRRDRAGYFQATPQNSIDQYCGGKGNLMYITDPAYTFQGVAMDSGGQVVEVKETVADPTRLIECSVKGSDGQTYTAQSAPYKETDEEFAAPICPNLPEGVVPAEITTSSVNEGTGKKTELAKPEINEEWLDWWKNNPECRTGGCPQELFNVTSGVALDCFESGTLCAGWYDDPLKEKNYQCRYNDKDVALDNCYVYSGFWQPGRIASGSPYSDPATGKWSGGQSSPSAGDKAMGSGIQNPDTFRSCKSEAGQINPIEWVLVPVKCALEWAFVPRTAVVKTDGAAMSEAWDNTAPVKVIGAIGGLNPAVSMSGCEGIPYSIKGIKYVPELSGTFGNACSGAPAEWAKWTRLVLSLFIISTGIIAIRATMGRTVDYGGHD